MEPLLKSLREFVEREQLFTPADKLLLACSGGLDSTILAHVLHAEGYDFAIAHVNFQLRGEASDGDAAFVKELARTLGAKYYYQAVDVKGRAQPGESTQMTARRLRYAWFNELTETEAFARVLVAHHLDDNFETLLLNLLRGTGIAGLRGMEARVGSVVRPLLETPRQDLQDYATNHQLSWREDASNATDDYLRNRVRHHLAPVFTEQFDLAPKTIRMTLENLRGTHAIYSRHLTIEYEKRRQQTGEMIHFDRTGTQAWSPAEVRAFLFRAVAQYGFNPEQISQIVRMADNTFLDAGQHRLYVTATSWTVGPLPTAETLAPVRVDTLPFTLPLGETKLTLELISRPANLGQGLYLAPPTLPLHLRPRQKGDRIQPLGLGGKTKKVKDYMIDAKIPVWLRDRIYLLVNDQDEIIAIPGYCIAEPFRVLPEHQKVLRID